MDAGDFFPQPFLLDCQLMAVPAGVESELSYYYMDIGGEEPSESSLTLRWANSVLGETTAEKEQQEGGTQINIEIVGPTQSPHSEVTFVIRERFAPTGDDREASSR